MTNWWLRPRCLKNELGTRKCPNNVIKLSATTFVAWTKFSKEPGELNRLHVVDVNLWSNYAWYEEEPVCFLGSHSQLFYRGTSIGTSDFGGKLNRRSDVGNFPKKFEHLIHYNVLTSHHNIYKLKIHQIKLVWAVNEKWDGLRSSWQLLNSELTVVRFMLQQQVQQKSGEELLGSFIMSGLMLGLPLFWWKVVIRFSWELTQDD